MTHRTTRRHRPRRQLTAVLATMLLATGGSALLTLSAPAHAQAAAAGSGFDAAFARFQQATPGQSDPIEDSVDQFGKLLAASPTDPVLRAYLGAATTLRATTTMLPWRKMQHAEEGLALIDKALAQLTPAHDAVAHHGVPGVLETRFVAANTFLGLPGMFNRGERGRKLLTDVLTSSHFGAAPAGFRATVWMRAGRLAETDQQTSQAREWYERVAASDAPQAAAARSRLKDL